MDGIYYLIIIDSHSRHDPDDLHENRSYNQDIEANIVKFGFPEVVVSDNYLVFERQYFQTFFSQKII